MDVDLSTVEGLEAVQHIGPSSIGIDTIYLSHGKIPEVFLKGAGVPNSFLEYMHSLVGKPVEYYSCFISYSSKDEALAERLYADLQSHDVSCWYAPEDLKWGVYIRQGINEGIRLHDKLLLVLSKHSIASGWIEHEVKIARAREKKENKPILFPVRVDKAIFDCPFDWATEIRHERNIGDFTRWKNHDDYEKVFNRLLRDLKSEAMNGYGCIDPSGMVAPWSDLACFSNSSITMFLVSIRSAPHYSCTSLEADDPKANLKPTSKARKS